MTKKPELLVPVGNAESFHAAINAGADAIYLGLKKFNARARANNFSSSQIFNIIKQAHVKNIKVYITLNTVIKQSELKELITILYFLSVSKIDGIIIQDWGLAYIIKTFFPELKMHASTQMGIHNSVGAIHAHKTHFKRIVVARELTLRELAQITSKSKAETEVFIHGALCYSFSGMCLFSSYAGGHGANRGMCTQPCRRKYSMNENQKFLFNLKDNEQIEQIEKLKKIGISSLKIEGRMKSYEYTFRVANAYRLAINNPEKKDEAAKLLHFDFGRDKTSYFLGKEIKNAISEKTATGIFLGNVLKVDNNTFQIQSEVEIQEGFRLRIYNKKQNKRDVLKVKSVKKQNDLFEISHEGKFIEKNAEIYLTGTREIKFSSKIIENLSSKIKPYSNKKIQHVLNQVNVPKNNNKEEIFVRINSLDWLRKIHLNEVDGIVLSFTKKSWSAFSPKQPFIQKNRHKIFIELPKFIAEKSINYYKTLAANMVKNGIKQFVIHHLSQKEIIPPRTLLISSENVYVFNNATSQMLLKQEINNFIYPFEIDFETLFTLANKSGWVPVYFYPELFYSRMPVQNVKDEIFSDAKNFRFKRFRRNGITSVIPDQPVSILQFKTKLKKAGFSKFMIDLSYEKASKNRFKTLKSRLLRSEQIQPSGTFNFTKGMQ